MRLNAAARIAIAKGHSTYAVEVMAANPKQAKVWLTQVEEATRKWFAASWTTTSREWGLLMQLRHLFPLDKKTYTIYRGTYSKNKLKKGARLRLDTRLDKRPIESWSLTKNAAEAFGDYVLKSTVTSEYVVFNREILKAMHNAADMLARKGYKELSSLLAKTLDNVNDYYTKDYGMPFGQNEVIVAVGAFPNGMTVTVISDNSWDG